MLRNRNLIPPGGFTFTQEETGLNFKEMSFDEIVNKIIKHREYKGLGPVDKVSVGSEVESFVCKTVPKHYLRG